MKATLVGYRNHSKRILDILLKNKEIKKIFIYVHKNNIDKNHIIKNKKIEYCLRKNFCFFESDLIFITSSSKSHYYYLKKYQKLNKFIFCEKPGSINFKQYEGIKKIIKKNNKIYFNFNDNFSIVKNNIIKDIKKKSFGKTIYIDFSYSNGISRKKTMKDNWRFNSQNIFNQILGNLGIHYIFFLIVNFGKPLKIFKKKYSIYKNNDTAFIFLQFKNLYSTIHLSYSSCTRDEITLKQQNNITKIINGKYFRFNPANLYNKSGLMISPKRKTINIINNLDDYKYSLHQSVNYFIEKSKKKKPFPNSFYNAYRKTLETILYS
jgi:hypothetical protein